MVPLFIGLLLFAFVLFSDGAHMLKGKIHYGGRGILHPERRSRSDLRHSVTFASKLRNADRLEEILYDVSDPDSPNYGKHWTRAQLGSFLQNEEGSRRLREYLVREGVTIISATPYDELITAEASIGTWERVFGTEFHEFVHEDWKGSVMNRALEYSLSEEINEYVESVFEVADFPAPVFHPSVISPMVSTEAAGSNPYPNFVSPSFLANHYRINRSVAKKNFGSQGILSCIGQMLSPADLAYFQKFFKLPKQTLTGSSGGHVTNKACQNSLDDCAEANLDVQYITAVGQNISTYNFYYDNCDWLQLVKDLLKLSNPPTVLSMSYSSYEAAFSNSFINTFNNAAMQLGVMGVTLFASSGDDGVSGFATQTTSDCAYSPQFPAANPYITSIGATQGPESNKPEITCQADLGGQITTGGGFSLFSPVPSWQSSVVSSYFAGVQGTTKQPRSGYSSGGRGYPDVSALGRNYIIAGNLSVFSVSGTSASSPVIAGMVSLVNSARLAAGQSSMGFLNPFLYAKSALFITDITSGGNFCTKTPGLCCPQGFYTTAGWDPATGLGVIDFTNFYSAATQFFPTAAPVVSPTFRPTTAKPSNSPTIHPTASSSDPIKTRTLNVDQDIDGVTAEDFSTNMAVYTETIKDAFIAIMPLANSISFSSFSLSHQEDPTDDFATRRSRRRRLPTATSVSVSYSAYIKSAQSQNFYEHALTEAVTQGTFTTALQQAAVTNGATGLQSASTSTVAFNQQGTSSSSSSSSSSDLTRTQMIAVIVVIVVVIILIAMMVYCCVRRCQSNENQGKGSNYAQVNMVGGVAIRVDNAPPAQVAVEILPSAPMDDIIVDKDGKYRRSQRSPTRAASSPSSPSSPTKFTENPYRFPDRAQSVKKKKMQKFDYNDII